MSRRIIIKGQDKTDKIEVLYVNGHYVRIKFRNSSKTYTYRTESVKMIETAKNECYMAEVILGAMCSALK